MSHTPTPWKLGQRGVILDTEGHYPLATCSPHNFGSLDGPLFVNTCLANAALIVRCVNERDGLLSLLKNAANRLRNQGGDIKPITEQLNWNVVDQIEATLKRLPID